MQDDWEPRFHTAIRFSNETVQFSFETQSWCPESLARDLVPYGVSQRYDTVSCLVCGG